MIADAKQNAYGEVSKKDVTSKRKHKNLSTGKEGKIPEELLMALVMMMLKQKAAQQQPDTSNFMEMM